METILKEIGLTEAESKIYIALLDLGETTVGPIADKSGVAYSKIYILLEKLINKGLASYITKNKVKYFSPADPKKILDYLDSKKENIEKQKNEIEKILPNLQKKLKFVKEKERVEVFEGYEGLKTVYNEELDLLNENDEILVIGGSAGAYTDKTKYQLFFKKINELRLKKKIRYKIIFNENVKNEENVTFWEKQDLTNVRYLLQDTPASLNIHSDRVMIIYWTKEMPKVFLISSKVAADSFKKYFEALWDIAKK